MQVLVARGTENEVAVSVTRTATVCNAKLIVCKQFSVPTVKIYP